MSETHADVLISLGWWRHKTKHPWSQVSESEFLTASHACIHAYICPDIGMFAYTDNRCLDYAENFQITEQAFKFSE